MALWISKPFLKKFIPFSQKLFCFWFIGNKTLCCPICQEVFFLFRSTVSSILRKERAISPLSAFPCTAMYEIHWRYRLKYHQLCCATSYQRLNAQQWTKEIYPCIYKLNVGSLRNQMVEPCVGTVGGGEPLGRRITLCGSMAFSSQLKPPLALNCSSLNVFTATHMHFFEIKEYGKLAQFPQTAVLQQHLFSLCFQLAFLRSPLWNGFGKLC